MIIPTHLGSAAPSWRVPAWHARAVGRFIVPRFIASDLRLAVASVLTGALLRAADALVRHVVGRAWRGARFAEDITAAASMVAAARH